MYFTSQYLSDGEMKQFCLEENVFLIYYFREDISVVDTFGL